MAYYSDKWTDNELGALENRIAEVFKDAEKDLNREVKEYFAKFALRDKEMKKLVETGDMSKEEYQRWRMTQIGRGQRFEALRDKVAERYTKANEVANALVNDKTPSIYSLNRNYEAYTIEKTVGSCDFTMWDESTVRRLLVEQPNLMPYYPPSRALNRGIDLAYGKSQITKHVTSGIIRGLPPGKIANELMANISGMSRASAVRAARTGITAAQNAGRMDSYVAAEKMGIQIRRKWVCTKDSRTRLDHGLVDGQIVVGTKTPFIVGGYKMMFPGDASLNAPGHEIYNCRCTTRTVEKDGIEAEPREMRVRNPEWEKAKAEEDKLSAKVDKLKEREQKETDPEKKKQLRRERIDTQKQLSAAAANRQGIDKNLVVNEMSYSDWKKWKESGVKPLAKSGNGGTMKVDKSATAIDGCKTPKEVADLMRSQKWFNVQTIRGKTYDTNDGINLDGVDVEAAKSIYRTHEKLFTKYPQLVGKLNSVSSADLSPFTYAQCSVGLGHGGITVNKKKFSSLESLKKSYANDLAHGFHPKGTTYASIVMHELGHAIDDYLTNTLQLAGMKNSWQPKWVSAYLRPKVMKACGMKVSDVGTEVSGYATKDHYEWLAECFCEFMDSDNPRKVAAEFGKQFDELMKGVK